MKNLMQKLVKVTLCLGVVSVTLISCEDDVVDNTIIDLDKIDDTTILIDSLVDELPLTDDTLLIEPISIDVEELEVKENEE